MNSNPLASGHPSVVERPLRPIRRTDLGTYGHPAKGYMTNSISQPPSARASPVARHYNSPTLNRRGRNYGVSRSSDNSPLTLPERDQVGHHALAGSSGVIGHGFPYYDDPGSPIMDPRPQLHNSSRSRIGRSALRGYSLDRETMDRDTYMMRDHLHNRDRSLDRIELSQRPARMRNRSLDRSVYLRDDPLAYRDRETLLDDPYRESVHRSHHHSSIGDPRREYNKDSFIIELQARLNELQNQYGHVKRELDATTQKLGSSMHSIKTFWSPELKKERALRKEEATKYALINDQLKILRSENQVSFVFLFYFYLFVFAKLRLQFWQLQ